MYERWGNRRRRTRRIGATVACERRSVATPRRDEVSSAVMGAVSAAPTGAPSRASAQVHRHVTGAKITKADGNDGRRVQHAAGGAGHDVRHRVDHGDRIRHRRCASLRARAGPQAPREARARRTLPPSRRYAKWKRAAPPPPAAGDDDAARVVLRPKRLASPECRAGARGRRGSR